MKLRHAIAAGIVCLIGNALVFGGAIYIACAIFKHFFP